MTSAMVFLVVLVALCGAGWVRAELALDRCEKKRLAEQSVAHICLGVVRGEMQAEFARALLIEQAKNRRLGDEIVAVRAELDQIAAEARDR